MSSSTSNGRRIVILSRGRERYVFIFDPDRQMDLLAVLESFASNPELSFCWDDVDMVLSNLRDFWSKVNNLRAF